MQFGQGKPSVGIVFDSDMGNTIDDALALALLYGLQGKGESRVISISGTKPNLKAAEFTDALVRFYTGEPGPFAGPTPIGLALKGTHPEDTPLILSVLDRKTDEGKPSFPRGVVKMNDTADPIATIRNALSAQFDQNAMVVLTGAATNLAALLDYPGNKALITAKARYLSVALGSYSGGPADPAVLADLAAARRLFADWPTPIVACGSEIGEAFRFPAASLDKDFAWAPIHPLVDAYRATVQNADAVSAAMAAALYAGRPQQNYFKLSDTGTISIQDDGRTKFTPSATGKHRYLIADPEQKDKILQAYVELASTKPVGRPMRVRPPVKKQ